MLASARKSNQRNFGSIAHLTAEQWSGIHKNLLNQPFCRRHRAFLLSGPELAHSRRDPRREVPSQDGPIATRMPVEWRRGRQPPRLKAVGPGRFEVVDE